MRIDPPRIAQEHGPESWARELRAGGWVEVRLNVWRAPDGYLYRGPYGAWVEMYRRQAEPERLLVPLAE